MKFNLGKLLFPKLPSDLQRRRMGNIYLTICVCAVAGLFIVFIIKKMSAMRGR